MMKIRNTGFLIFLFLMCAAMVQGQTDRIKFSHKYHIQEEELDCSDCHAGVEQSKAGKDNLLPTQETCSDCHDVAEKDSCQKCHTKPDFAGKLQPITHYNGVFSHQKHLLDTGLNCTDCHSNVASAGYGQKVVLPDMIQCMTCHEQKQQPLGCRTCHTLSENIRPDFHGLDFIRAHGQMAETHAVLPDAPKTCETCHKSTYCEDCHEGENLSRKTHPLNFEFTHSLEAQSNEKNCITCHTDRSFCTSCHLENHVIPHNHTAGWSNNIPGDGGRHRFEALSDLESCMSCHEDNADQICRKCHVGKGVIR